MLQTRREALATLCGAVAAGVLGSGCSSNAPDPWPEKSGLKILTSFAPIHCFAMNVAGDSGNVLSVMQSQGPHDFQPGTAEARMVNRADIFFVNGLGLDTSIAKKMVRTAGRSKTNLIDLGASLPVTMLLEGGDCGHDHSADEGHTHEHDEHDAHIWMGLPQARTMVAQIRDQLKALSPADAATFDQNALAYTRKLEALQAEGELLLKPKAEKAFISFHGSMQYFTATFGMQPPEVIQQIAGHEPTSKELSSLVSRCVDKKIRIIAVEPQYSSTTSAKVILAELKLRGIADAEFVVLDPLETATAAEFGPDWYETKMRANLQALAKVLK